MPEKYRLDFDSTGAAPVLLPEEQVTEEAAQQVSLYRLAKENVFSVVCIAIAVIALSLMAFCSQRAAVSNTRLQQAQSTVALAKSELNAKKTELDSKLAKIDIKEYAEEKLNMVKAEEVIDITLNQIPDEAGN